jgi:excisionase family DNA binding protein
LSYLTTRQVAEILNVSTETVVNMCKDGRLRHIRLDRQYRIPDDALEEFTGEPRHVLELDADAARLVAEARAAGRIPADPPPELVGLIVAILRQYYADQPERTAS